MSGLSSIFQLFNCIVNIYKLEAYESGCCCCSFVNIWLLQVVFCSRWEAELRPLFCLPARFNLPNPSLLSRELRQNSPTCCDGSISAPWVWVHISLWLVYNWFIFSLINFLLNTHTPETKKWSRTYSHEFLQASDVAKFGNLATGSQSWASRVWVHEFVDPFRVCRAWDGWGRDCGGPTLPREQLPKLPALSR